MLHSTAMVNYNPNPAGTVSETDIPFTAPAKYAYGMYARQRHRPQQPVWLAASRDVQRCGSTSWALACGSSDVAVTADHECCGVPQRRSLGACCANAFGAPDADASLASYALPPATYYTASSGPSREASSASASDEKACLRSRRPPSLPRIRTPADNARM